MESQVFYFIYKTTNLINGKIYVGKHKTKNLGDGYVGSGKLLKAAVNKYGREKFKVEILEWFDNETSMNSREAELVTEEFCLRDDNYNLCAGGRGGFSYIYRERLWDTPQRLEAAKRTWSEKAKRRFAALKAIPQDELTRRRALGRERSGKRSGHKKGQYHHSDAAKQKVSESKRGTGTGHTNSQSGSFWITDGVVNKKIRGDVIPLGWRKGRVLK